MVSALTSRSNRLGVNLGWGHWVTFLGKTFYSHSASFHPGVYGCTGELNAEM